MNRHAVRLTVAALLLGGCAAPRASSLPRYEPPVIVAQPRQAKGSLWVDGGGYGEDVKARRPGDIVTVLVSESASASKQATTGTKRGGSASAGIPGLLGLEKTSIGIIKDMALDKLVSASTDFNHSASGSTSRQETLYAKVSAVVTDVYPNGTMRIQGRRFVTVNSEEQEIQLDGVVRQRDIGSDNTVSSASLADAHISYSGTGVVSEVQEPGWLLRGLSRVWPF